ncbi:MAG: MhpC, partial [Deltaproteobacteria bacterium]|nr:MhpC [Deltaproteobacteria bacterium]
MPKVKVKAISLYYEVHGSGYPLVLIRGLASNADHWYCQVPAFSAHYSVVVFDEMFLNMMRAFTPNWNFLIFKSKKIPLKENWLSE